jgi:hypothetical protein
MSKPPTPIPLPAAVPAATLFLRSLVGAKIPLIRVFVLIAAGGAHLGAQGPNPLSARGSDRLWLGGRSPMLEDVARAIGDRFQTVGKSRVTIAGTLVDGRTERQITYSWQLPGLFRLEDSRGGLMQFNGNRLDMNAVARQAGNNVGLIQSLIGDQIETILWSMVETGNVHFIGARFRLDDNRVDDDRGPWVNYYEQVLAPQAKGNFSGVELRRLVAVDSVTQRLRFVRYFSPNQKGIIAETEFVAWRLADQQWFPTEIVRRENNREVFRFRITQSAAGENLSTAAFGEVAK